jgi:hypothetical protein
LARTNSPTWRSPILPRNLSSRSNEPSRLLLPSLLRVGKLFKGTCGQMFDHCISHGVLGYGVQVTNWLSSLYILYAVLKWELFRSLLASFLLLHFYQKISPILFESGPQLAHARGSRLKAPCHLRNHLYPG